MRSRSRRPVTSVAFASLVIAALAATSADAKTDPVVACAAFKLKSAGALAAAQLTCHAKAAAGGATVDQKCLGVPGEKLIAGFAKAEAAARKAGAACASEGDAGETRERIEAEVVAIATALHPTSGSSKCTAKKIAAVGKQIVQRLGGHAKHLLKPDAAKLTDVVTKSIAGLGAVFAKADDKGKDCQTSHDFTPVANLAVTLVGAELCDDGNRCLIDTVVGVDTCMHSAVTCAATKACDFRTGTCEPANCCLMSNGGTSCVVPIPDNQIATSQAFCAGVHTAKPALTVLQFGPSCINWRAAGFTDCP